VNLDFIYTYTFFNHNTCDLLEMISVNEYENLIIDIENHFMTSTINGIIIKDHSYSLGLFQKMMDYIHLNLNFIIDKYQIPSGYNFQQIIKHIANKKILESIN